MDGCIRTNLLPYAAPVVALHHTIPLHAYSVLASHIHPQSPRISVLLPVQLITQATGRSRPMHSIVATADMPYSHFTYLYVVN